MRIRDMVSRLKKVYTKINALDKECEAGANRAMEESTQLRINFLKANLRKFKGWKVVVGRWTFVLFTPLKNVPPTFAQLFRTPFPTGRVTLQEYGKDRSVS